MVALLRTPAPRSSKNLLWCDPAFACRTLYFPWRGGASFANQRYLLRCSDITGCNKYHLTRRLVQPGPESVTDKLHETLGHLNGLRDREATKPHLAHPSLAELYPADAAPPLLVALQQQLGLKVAPTKEQVEILVIDHVERPSAN